MPKYYQVKQATFYDNHCDTREWDYNEKDFAKIEDAKAYLAERIKAFEDLAEHVAEYFTGNHTHCYYNEDGVLDCFDRDKYYTDHRPELIIKPLH